MTLPIRFALRAAARTALVAVAFGAFSLLPVARADEGDDEADALTAKLKAQLEKVIRLMRENEKALLAASQGGGNTTKPVEVKPPEPNSTATPPAPPPPAPPAMDGGDGSVPPGERGEEIRRRMRELIEGSQERGQQIPIELEELVKMIPQTEGQSGQPDNTDSSGKPLPNPDEAQARKAGEKPESGKDPKGSQEKKDPKSPTGEKGGTSDKPPGGGGTDEEKRDGVPAWITELPREIRQMLTSGETDKIPSPYKERIQAYLDSLRKQSKDSGR